MKLKNYLIAFAAVCVVASLSSCKKDNASKPSSSDEVTATIELSGDQAISDNLNADAENVLNEAAVDNSFAGNTPVGITQTMDVLSCAIVTVSQGAFPKTITIDFGAGCTPQNGTVLRSGKIHVTLSDSLRKSGSVAVMTFENYYVSGFKKEGTITWTNTTAGDEKSWTRTCTNGKITAPGGRYWLHSGSQTITQTEGSSTQWNLLDDVISVTGSHTVTNAAGISRTSEIITALEKKVTCENIDKGSVKITGPNHYALIDFGNGDCDNKATISIDGGTAIPFLLR
jgi:hypothetical protein